MSGELDYGNARVRARRGDLIGGSRLRGLLDLGLRELGSALSEGPLREDVQDALLRFEGLRMIQEALRLHLARSLRSMLFFYEEGVRSSLRLLLSKFDLRNLLVVLRGQARRMTAAELIPLMVPAARLDEATLTELARQPGLRATLDRMVTWGLPSRRVASRLLDSWPEYERYDDVARLEHHLTLLHTEDLGRKLDGGGVPSPLDRVLRLGVDQRQLVTALRLWEAREQGDIASTAEGSHRWGDLAGGLIDPGALRDAIERRRPEEVLAAILRAAPGHLFLPEIERWSRDGSLDMLEARLEERLTRWALAHTSAADPLSIAVPVGYAFAKEAEVRNLRLVAAVAAGRVPRRDTENRFVSLTPVD